MGLLGPSGSGKTTLMRSIAGLQKIQSGEIEVLGRPAAHKELRHEIGYSTQSASVYSDLTCIENIEFFASLYFENEKSPQQILDEVGLTPNQHQMAESLSGGERARLALATTLVGSPQLLILDEPTVGLDPVLRVALWQLFAGLAAQGKTLLVSSHVMDEADSCEQLVLLRNGEVLAEGTPIELRAETGMHRMDDVFISLIGKAEFIGGYAMAFGIASLLQATAVSSYAIWVLGLRIAGLQITLIYAAILDALIGLAIGLAVSTFAKTEFIHSQATDQKYWRHDVIAGVTVGIVALPLALAFGITTGAGARAGLITAIYAGLIAAIFGGSNFQVSGPTGAMTVVLIPIVLKYGTASLAPLGLAAGLLVVVMGFTHCGALIKRVPWPVMEGFTLGIALSRLGELFVVQFPLVHIPASFVSIIVATLLVPIFSIHTPLIGNLPRSLYAHVALSKSHIGMSALFVGAVEIALLAAIESLLSARVADQMAHIHESAVSYKPNRELIGQGLATMVSSMVGGMPATGAIARTSVNVRSKAQSRISSITHAAFLLLVVLVLNPVIAHIPTAALGAVLIGQLAWMQRPYLSLQYLLS
eukprot:gene1293-1310_t